MLLSMAAAQKRISSFTEFKAAYGKIYESVEEEAMRASIFAQTIEEIEAHNAKNMSWKMGVNQFSDLTHDEFQATILMTPQNCSATTRREPIELDAGADLPDTLDWRMRGIVSEVKNQGSCGSCWTFSTVAALEAHLALKADNWRAPRLSEQQLVDCAFNFDTQGCNGGLPSHAFEYIKYAGGLQTEFSYPYTAVTGTCSFAAPEDDAFVPQSSGIGVVVPGGSVNLTAGDENELKYFLATKGPISVAFDVASDFKNYESGVYSSNICKSGAMNVNHAVLAVGYGTTANNESYWLIKNSWDYTWGDFGYFKIEAFKNMCGIAQCNSYPDLYGSS